MADPVPVSLLVVAALGLGLRHGVDWDHISAIMDITSSQKTLRGGVVLGWFYAGGHGTVVAALGLAAVLVGLRLPPEVDTAMTAIVGVTLIILGVYVIHMLVRHPGEQFRMQSRWVLIASGILRAYERAVLRLTGSIRKRREIDLKAAGPISAYIVGIIHGIGGETPTQILLFIIAGGVSGAFAGVTVVLAFVLGVFITNTIESVLASLGYSRTAASPKLFRRVAAVAAVFSLVIGLIFLVGASGILPALS
jgi:high-affinity nickel-transport protein